MNDSASKPTFRNFSMGWFVTKLAISALTIAFVSWLSGKRPGLSGVLLALPIVTLLSLPLAYLEYRNLEQVTTFARSTLLAIPISLVFFLPFVFAPKLRFGFWGLYGIGLALLTLGIWIHRQWFPN